MTWPNKVYVAAWQLVIRMMAYTVAWRRGHEMMTNDMYVNGVAMRRDYLNPA